MITPGKRQQRRKWNSETAKYRVLGKILEATKGQRTGVFCRRDYSSNKGFS